MLARALPDPPSQGSGRGMVAGSAEIRLRVRPSPTSSAPLNLSASSEPLSRPKGLFLLSVGERAPLLSNPAVSPTSGFRLAHSVLYKGSNVEFRNPFSQ